MESKRLEIKVGLFVLIGLALLAALLIQFSKGTSLFHGTYALRLVSPNVGGLKLKASVLLAGVQVGAVSDIKLAADGKSVTIILNIYKNVVIYGDAHFVIEQAGFLGDQFVAILPTQNQKPPLTNNEQVNCDPPFDLQQVARSATGFIQRVNDTMTKVEASVTKLQNTVLNDQTLTNLSITIANLRTASEGTAAAVGNINMLVMTNNEKINLAVSNVVLFSQELTQLADNANGILATNGVAISGAMTNLEMTTETLKQIADDLRAGRGLAGTILENQQLATNVQETVNNLEMVSSNLNEFGLWHILWDHSADHKARAQPNDALESPRESESP